MKFGRGLKKFLLGIGIIGSLLFPLKKVYAVNGFIGGTQGVSSDSTEVVMTIRGKSGADTCKMPYFGITNYWDIPTGTGDQYDPNAAVGDTLEITAYKDTLKDGNPIKIFSKF
ncbi:hypothetical protein KAW65_05355 [candidate division WOR-3 bacterium]|nr:hypothetical protein [candidate division WOR-3 bacterium]